MLFSRFAALLSVGRNKNTFDTGNIFIIETQTTHLQFYRITIITFVSVMYIFWKQNDESLGSFLGLSRELCK